MSFRPPLAPRRMNRTAPAPLPDPDLTGRRIGAYQVLRRLGRGAMAEVYLAEQQSLKRPVALKVLKRDLRERYWVGRERGVN